MKYIYKTVSGYQEIEVNERQYNILDALDREERNADRKYYRHNPISLSNTEYEGAWMADGTDILGDLIDSEDREHLFSTLAQLTRDQQTLIEQIFINNVKIVDIARKLGVSPVAIQNRLNKIFARMKKILL